MSPANNHAGARAHFAPVSDVNIKSLRGVLHLLLTETQDVDLDDLTTEEVVDLGQVLWRLIKHSGSFMENIKKRLRGEARDQTESGEVEFEGAGDSLATVKVPATRPRLRQDADLMKLEQQLANEGIHKAKFVRQIVRHTLRRDFEKQVAKATPDVARLVLSVVDYIDSTPRVSFKD